MMTHGSGEELVTCCLIGVVKDEINWSPTTISVPHYMAHCDTSALVLKRIYVVAILHVIIPASDEFLNVLIKSAKNCKNQNNQ